MEPFDSIPPRIISVLLRRSAARRAANRSRALMELAITVVQIAAVIDVRARCWSANARQCGQDPFIQRIVTGHRITQRQDSRSTLGSLCDEPHPDTIAVRRICLV